MNAGDSGTSVGLRPGDRFTIGAEDHGRIHRVVADRGSHLEYDGGERISKGELVRRVAEGNPSETLVRIREDLEDAAARLEADHDTSEWMQRTAAIVSLAGREGLQEIVPDVEALESVGTETFSGADEDRSTWEEEKARVLAGLRPMVAEDVRRLIREIVRKCGGDWCLYTRSKGPNGKRRRLGKHPSKEAAYRQERAIKAHGG